MVCGGIIIRWSNYKFKEFMLLLKVSEEPDHISIWE